MKCTQGYTHFASLKFFSISIKYRKMKNRFQGVIHKIWSWSLQAECFFWNSIHVIMPGKKLKAICLKRAMKAGMAAQRIWPTKMETIKMSPRVFISPPFVECPNCKKISFGVRNITSSSYSRRCGECLFPKGDSPAASFDLPKLKKKILYLDQCAISNMMKALNPHLISNPNHSIDPFWNNLFAKIFQLCKMQRVVCVDSSFHTDESLPTAFYRDLKDFFERLSHGVTFIDRDTIQNIQIIEHAKNWIEGNFDYSPNMDITEVTHGDVHGWKGRLIISVDFNYSKDWIDELQKVREKKHQILGSLFLEWKNEKGLTFEKVQEREGKYYGDQIVSSHNEYLDAIRNGIFPTPNQQKNNSLVNQICKLFESHGLSNEEVNSKIIEYLHSPIFDKIPFVNISALFLAGIARKAISGQVKPPNQGMANDLFVISHFLPYCDAIFLDNECAALLSENPIKEQLNEYGTKIFSLNTKDDFIRYLDEIGTSNQTPDKKLIEDVYGKNWLDK